MCIGCKLKNWNIIVVKRFPKIASNFSQTPPTFALSASGIRMPSLGSTIGELRRSSVWEEKIVSKILLPPSVRTSCERIRRWRVKGS